MNTLNPLLLAMLQLSRHRCCVLRSDVWMPDPDWSAAVCQYVDCPFRIALLRAHLSVLLRIRSQVGLKERGLAGLASPDFVTQSAASS